jgi:hypothetical protein
MVDILQLVKSLPLRLTDYHSKSDFDRKSYPPQFDWKATLGSCCIYINDTDQLAANDV